MNDKEQDLEVCMNYHNIMVDIEAFDSKRTAIVVSIGAVYFDPVTGQLGDEFYMEVSKKGIQEQYNAGRTFSFDTFIWWMHQDDNARNVFKKNEHEKHDIVHVLFQFHEFVRRSVTNSTHYENAKVWGNGVDYDNVVMRDLYETFNIQCPWTYANNRCYRTMKNMFGYAAKLERVGTHHNGLDDSKTQAVHLMKMLAAVKK